MIKNGSPWNCKCRDVTVRSIKNLCGKNKFHEVWGVHNMLYYGVKDMAIYKIFIVLCEGVAQMTQFLNY